MTLLGTCPGLARAEESRAKSDAEKIRELDYQNNVFSDAVAYPEWLLGQWDATSELDGVETPQGDAVAGEAAIRARGAVGTEASLEREVVRFITANGKVVADRTTGLQLLLRALATSPGTKPSVEWEPSEANKILATVTNDGTIENLKLLVLLRTGVVPEGRIDRFNASEVLFSYKSQGDEATPIRFTSKFRLVDGPQVQVLQRFEVFPAATVAGAMNGSDLGTPVAVYRYKTLMLRPASSAA